MGKVSGTSSSKGGFIGRANGTSTFENVFYYSAFNTVKAPVGNNPGLSDIKVINDPHDILADDDSKTVNTHVYDTPTLEGETYPYKNWTSEQDDTSMTMVPTYYGDWPKQILLNGKFVFYIALDPNNYKNGGSFSFTGAETSFNADLVKYGNEEFQLAGFGIISEIGDRDIVKKVYKWSYNPTGSFEFVDLEGASKYSTFSYYGKPYYFYRISTDLLEKLALEEKSPDTFYIADASETILYKVRVKDGKAMFESYN